MFHGVNIQWGEHSTPIKQKPKTVSLGIFDPERRDLRQAGQSAQRSYMV